MSLDDLEPDDDWQGDDERESSHRSYTEFKRMVVQELGPSIHKLDTSAEDLLVALARQFDDPYDSLALYQTAEIFGSAVADSKVVRLCLLSAAFALADRRIEADADAYDELYGEAAPAIAGALRHLHETIQNTQLKSKDRLDAIDHAILEICLADPSIPDSSSTGRPSVQTRLAERNLQPLDRVRINTRRNNLRKMGYPV